MNNVTNNSTGFPWIEVTLIIIGLVADLIAVNRRLLEEARFRLLRLEYRLGSIRERK